MEKKERSEAIDNPEIISPSANSPATDVYDEIGSTSRNSLESEEQKPALSQRLAEAFREGIASTKPDYDKRPEVRILPPVQTTARKDPQQSGDARTLDRVIQEGGSAASVLYDKAAGALDSAVRLAKTAPAVSTRWAEAFREGFESVRTREVKAKKDRIPCSADRQQSGDRGIVDRILHVGGSAAEVVRGAVASVQPGEVRGAEKKIRMAEKKIKDLYVEIGQDAVGSWSTGGPIETEKLDELLDELRRNEEGIRNLREYIAETAAARKAEAVRSKQGAKEAVFTPARDKEHISFDVGVSGAKVDEHVEIPGNWQQPESPEGGDFAVAETSDSAAPEVESPVTTAAPEQAIDAETARPEEVSDDADQVLPEEPVVSQEKTEEEVSDEADQALSEEPHASPEKTEDTEVLKNR